MGDPRSGSNARGFIVFGEEGGVMNRNGQAHKYRQSLVDFPKN